MSEKNVITKEELIEVIKENKIQPSQVFDEERLKADPEVQKMKDKAVAKLKAEIKAEEDKADFIPGDEPAPTPLTEAEKKEADHIPDNDEPGDGSADHIPD